MYRKIILSYLRVFRMKVLCVCLSTPSFPVWLCLNIFSSKTSDDFVSRYLISFGWRNPLIYYDFVFQMKHWKKENVWQRIFISFIIRTHCDDQKCVSPLIKMLATLSLMVHVPLLKRWVPLSSDWSLGPHSWPLIGQICLGASLTWCKHLLMLGGF